MRIIMLLMVTAIFLGCGKISQEKERKMVENATNLMNAFARKNPVPELYDGNNATGGIAFTWNYEATNDNIYVDVIGVTNPKQLDLIISTVTELAKKMNIQNNIYLRQYKKYRSDGSYSSDDMYEKGELHIK